MRVLKVHRWLRHAPSGENTAVELDVALLRAAGHDVHIFDLDDGRSPTSRLGQLAARQQLVKPFLDHQFARCLEEVSPDIVHAHSLYGTIAASIVAVAHRRGIPVVQTIHNYRFRCVEGFYLRDDHPCFECRDARSSLPALRHGCRRRGRLQHASLVVSETVNRRRWEQVDAYIAISAAVAEQLRLDGVDDAKIALIPSVEADSVGSASTTPGRGLAFAGRLSDQKGASLLVAAWCRAASRHTQSLVIAGSGGNEIAVRALAAEEPSITFLGFVSEAQVLEVFSSAAAVAFPSHLEPFGRSAAKALCLGRPLIAVRDSYNGIDVDPSFGWLADERTPASLAAAIDQALADPVELTRRGAAARRVYEQNHHPALFVDRLVDVYARTIAGR